jgi:hypothetical protein
LVQCRDPSSKIATAPAPNGALVWAARPAGAGAGDKGSCARARRCQMIFLSRVGLLDPPQEGPGFVKSR